MGKHFVINPVQEEFDRSVIAETMLEGELIKRQAASSRETFNNDVIKRETPLKFIPKRVIVKVDLEFKNSHTFEDGTKIRLERQYNNFNKRETEPVNAIVISAEHIPKDAEILVWHNALHDTNRIFDYPDLSGEQTDVKYYSLPEEDCFAWRTGNDEFKPLKGFQFGLRVFEPYKGVMVGIEPTLIKDVLYVQTGGLAGNVVGTLKASDYEIIYQDSNGRENRLIRFRHSDDEELERDEVIYISNELTERLLRFELLIGLSPKDAKTIINHGN